ncbi:MAG: M48 family metalloprotease [Pirellulaceae bacterium]
MPIQFLCGKCKKEYKVPDDLGGRKVRCRECKAHIQVPLPTSEEGKLKLQQAQSGLYQAPSRKPETPAKAANDKTAKAKQQIHPEFLLGAIKGRIKRVRTSITYRIASLVVAALMILLPLVYVALIALAIYGVYYHATHATVVFSNIPSRRASRYAGLLALLLYVGPIVIGVIAVLFMIKPLFARSAKVERRRSLTRDGEPLLFAFVDKLCESVHSPKPKRIDVDNDVNASASFRRGLWSMLLPGDLVLTIGMPLAAGLTCRQLAGVLAHEFGHFSQGAGMRLTYLIRRINMWFSRVVYERDVMDEWLTETANSIDIRIGIVLHLARLIVWLSRGVLWVLMMIGHFFSSFLMQQMEYDADMHEIRFSGSDNFRKTFEQLRLLGIGYQQAMYDQRTYFMEGRLANDMARLTVVNRDAISKTKIREILESALAEKTKWHETHPADADRIKRAERAQDEGVFHLEQPASVLFRHFESTCKAVTHDYFKAIFEGKVGTHMWASVDSLVSHKNDTIEAEAATARILGEHFELPRPINAPAIIESPADINEHGRKLKAIRKKMIELLPVYKHLGKKLIAQDSRWMMQNSCAFAMEMGLSLKQEDFDFNVRNARSAQSAATTTKAELSRIHENMTELEKLFEMRIKVNGDLLQHPGVAAKIGERASEMNTLLANVRSTLPAIHKAYGNVLTLRNDLALANLVINLFQNTEPDEMVVRKFRKKRWEPWF